MPLDALRAGALHIRPNLILAPMSGITGSAFRRLIKEANPGAVGLVFSEFISVEALTRHNRRSIEMHRVSESERPAVIQLFGFNIERMVQAAQMVQDGGAEAVDINCGCPVPKVVKKGGGCELMRRPEHLRRMLTELRRVLRVPLTVKIRAGWDSSSLNAPEIARLAADCGAEMVSIHGRTCKQLYKGAVDWGIVSEVIRSCPVPVAVSGDICDQEKAAKAWDTGAAALMIGRAALANPWIFSELAEPGSRSLKPDKERLEGIVLRYRDLLREELPEKAVLGRLKQFGLALSRGIRGSSALRRRLCLSKDVDEFGEVLHAWDEYPDEPEEPALVNAEAMKGPVNARS